VPDHADASAEPRQCLVQATFLGTRLDTREFERREPLALNPLTVPVGNGYAVLFRYGVVALVNVGPGESSSFLKGLGPHVTDPFDEPETDTLTISPAPDRKERMEADGILHLQDTSLQRVQTVVTVLAKSVVLAHYEERVGTVFDRVEQLVDQMKGRRMARVSGSDLLQQIGDVLIVQTQTVGRVEVTEKPEITWDRPDLDRLYEQLSLEYELRERDRALNRKLSFISSTAQMYLDLVETRKSLRLEWYIVVLILVEIVLFIYELFLA
jgi:uncharacterized Rmd1/YagE family protein